MARKENPDLQLGLSLAGVVVLVVFAVGVGWCWSGQGLSAGGDRSLLVMSGIVLIALFGWVAYYSVWRPIELWKATEQELVRVTTTDPLTNLLNRVAILDRMTLEMNRSGRTGNPVSLAVVSIDNIEALQQRFGMATRNTVLRCVGNLIGTSCRQYDTAGRYGSNSFLIALPHTEIDGAARAAERLRDRVEKSEFACDGVGYAVTVSVGVTQMDRGENESMDLLMNRADDALKQARAEGGNRVHAIAPVSAVAPPDEFL
jgi:diguanylate cyclase (GGDEF)-like protein